MLEGRYARLEPIDPKHAAGLFAATAGEGEDERYRWLMSLPAADEAELRHRLADAAAIDDPLYFAVVDKATGLAGGQQSLMRIEPTHGVIEIGGILWGRGVARTRLATEALYLFAAYVFDTLGYRRFEWKCNNLNEPSKRAALRFGFASEGVFRQHMVTKGKNRDTAWFAMIDQDWPALKLGYQKWLDPSNFDANGQQLTSLMLV